MANKLVGAIQLIQVGPGGQSYSHGVLRFLSTSPSTGAYSFPIEAVMAPAETFVGTNPKSRRLNKYIECMGEVHE